MVEPCEAGRAEQFPPERALASGPVERPCEAFLSVGVGAGGTPQKKQFALRPQLLGDAPASFRALRASERIVDDRELSWSRTSSAVASAHQHEDLGRSARFARPKLRNSRVADLRRRGGSSAPSPLKRRATAGGAGRQRPTTPVIRPRVDNSDGGHPPEGEPRCARTRAGWTSRGRGLLSPSA